MKRHLKAHLARRAMDGILRHAFGAGARAVRVTICHGGLFNTSYRLYRGCGALQASLEEALYFRRGLGA